MEVKQPRIVRKPIRKLFIQPILHVCGYKIERLFPRDLKLDTHFSDIYKSCIDSTSIERMYALYKSIRHIIEKEIDGDFVECGVASGGSCVLMAKTLLKLKQTDRKIYLYDTFEGMPRPTERDIGIDGINLIEFWEKHMKKFGKNRHSFSLDEVKKNMYSTGYPKKNLIFIKGLVEKTIPKVTPKKISLLRLDTDYYESISHELKHLYPKVVNGGIIILDDYGGFLGAKDAVDEYFKEKNINVLLNRIDGTGRLCIKD